MSRETPEGIRRRFAEMVCRDEDAIDLAEAALLIAAEEYSRIDIAQYIDKLDRIGDLAREQASDCRTPLDFISVINTTLFERFRFHGNVENYYDPRNSYLNDVIDRQTGIPITLTIVYMEVARRIGFPVRGVGLPGHFISKHSSETGDVFIDPFNRGRVLGEVECSELLANMSGGKGEGDSGDMPELRPDHLLTASTKQILTRMLSNLLAIYSGSADHGRALSAIERILLINPDSLSHIRDRGLLLAAAGRPGNAIEELERYLAMAEGAPDSRAIREQMKSIRQAQAKLN